MMKVINPTDKAITVNYLQEEYTVEANGTLLNVPDEVAVWWKNRLHNFLILKQDDVVKVEVVEKETSDEEKPVEEKKVTRQAKKVSKPKK